METEKIAPDTSIIIEGALSAKLESMDINPSEVLIHEILISELEHLATMEHTSGYLGLDELKRLRAILKDRLKIVGKKPAYGYERHMPLSDIDSLIRKMAFEEGAAFMTSDKINASAAEASGMQVIFIELKAKTKMILEKFFDETTMSVHLKENVFPFGKKGFPGNWTFEQLRKTVLKQEEIKEMSRDIIDTTNTRKDSFVEIERMGSTIVQVGPFRIVITRPPFSDGWEITAVRPVKKLSLDDYKMSEKLTKRVAEQAEGILVAGAPGMGKCHGKGTPILMYDGSIKKVEDIKNGDLIMGPDSKPRIVLGNAHGYGKLYRVIPVKGDPYIVNEDHILSLKYKNRKKL